MFKKIKAMIEPFDLEEVTEALKEMGIEEVTITSCKNFEPRKGPASLFRGKKETGDFKSEAELELVIDEALTGKVIETLQKTGSGSKEKQREITILSIDEAFPLDRCDAPDIPGSGVSP